MSHANTGPSSSSNNSWRNPSQAQQQKYNIRPVPDSFVPTPEEQQLLDLYDVVRSHERVAARLKEEAARAKLLARDAEFQQKQQLASSADQRRSNKRTRKTNSRSKDDGDDDDLDNVSEEEEDDDDDDDDLSGEEKTLHDRRQEKLDELRMQVEEKKQALNAASSGHDDAELRRKLLTVTETVDDEPMLKKKKPLAVSGNSNTGAPSSLIANLGGTQTPPHDFSEKLGLAQATRGSVLLPVPWTPPAEGASDPNEGAFLVDLPDFDIARAQNASGYNTLLIKCMIPADSKRFSINIANADNNGFSNILFHFNPRQLERGGQLVINDKREGTWGNSLVIPLSQIPLMFGQESCTLMIQINGEGFDVFVEHVHCARLEHRSEIPAGATKLVLQFPSTDDSLSPERWTVFKVWWGQRPILAKGDVSAIPGTNSFNAEHPRKLFISGLPRITSETEVELRRAELERAFRKYGGDRGVQVIVPTNASYAFVEMESESMTDLALKELGDTYRMNRARRSRHEALREERAARDAMKSGATATTSVWD